MRNSNENENCLQQFFQQKIDLFMMGCIEIQSINIHSMEKDSLTQHTQTHAHIVQCEEVDVNTFKIWILLDESFLSRK